MSETRKERQEARIDICGERLTSVQGESAKGRKRSQDSVCDWIDMRSKHPLEGLHKTGARTAAD